MKGEMGMTQSIACGIQLSPVSGRVAECEERGWRTMEMGLSCQERDLLYLLAQGRTSPQIADTMNLSLAEVEATLRQLQERFGLTSRRRLVVMSILQGWFQPL